MRSITLQEYEDYLQSWQGVPYRDGGMSRQGVDCLRFVVLVGDWLHGWDSSQMDKPPTLSKQTALHDGEMTLRVVRWTRQRYPNELIRVDEHYETRPGDVVVCRNQVNPGHGLIAGSRPNELWHALNGSAVNQRGEVFKTNLGWCMAKGIVCAFRPTESLLCFT